jgi:hypothetical protein
MKISTKLRPKATMLSDARRIIPALFDGFTSKADLILDHPRRVVALHRMRLDGKPLRYAMEDLQKLFGRDYRKCVVEVKETLEVMGLIHEADVLLPVLKRHLTDLVAYNAMCVSPSSRIPTGGLRQIMRAERRKRGELFVRLCRQLRRWKSTNFRHRLLRAMEA